MIYNKTQWSWMTTQREFDSLITSTITDRIGRRELVLLIVRKNYNFREQKKSKVMKEEENLH